MKARVLIHPSAFNTVCTFAMPKCQMNDDMAAPAYEPTRACELEVGSPSHHVTRFQAIAPITPASSTYSLSSDGITAISTISPPTVFATAVPKTTTATKLKKPAHITATPGERTRVATTVAIELAAS